MKDLLIQTAQRTGILNAQQLSDYLENNKNEKSRLDDVVLTCPYFTEDVVLKLFAAALGWEYLNDVSPKDVPSEFIENVPATYAQHHFLIGIKKDQHDKELVVVLSKPLDANALDNVSKMTGLSVRPAVAIVLDPPLILAYRLLVTGIPPPGV